MEGAMLMSDSSFVASRQPDQSTARTETWPLHNPQINRGLRNHTMCPVADNSARIGRRCTRSVHWMAMSPFDSPAEAQFAHTISDVAYCNPFLPERIEYERVALGEEFVDA